jgi:AraC-like DNA-binding protein
MTPHRTQFLESYHYIPDSNWAKAAFAVMRAGEAITAPGYRIARDDYPGQDILFCRAGRGFAHSEGVTMRIGAHQLVWIANEMPHAHWPDDTKPWHLLWLRMTGPDCAALRRKIFGHGPTIVTLARPAQLELWFARLFQTLRRREADIDLAVNHLMAEFLYLLGTRAEQPDQRALPKPLRLATTAMRDAPSKPWQADAIALAGGTSATNLRRLFQQHFGLSPRRWLMNERIILSQRLLSEGRLTVAEAADTCGFCDVYHFTRVFRRAVGMGPAAWRRAEGMG